MAGFSATFGEIAAKTPDTGASIATLSDALDRRSFGALAFVLGIVQFAAPKGTLPHRTIGWIWVLLMFAVALSSFWIHEIRLVGPFSPIHLLSIFAPIMLVLAVVHARRHNVSGHRKAMTSIFFGALIVAGLFTFLPGRIMHAVVFGH